MPIAATRSMLHAALSGRLESAAFRTDDVFGFEVPEKVPGVDTKLLDPRSTWRDPEAYDEQASRLARMFVENLTKFGDAVAHEIAAAAPRS
jgi:phosphoenolpyruvate carboxykinase (ATP)